MRAAFALLLAAVIVIGIASLVFILLYNGAVMINNHFFV